jgi:hypothetical protein
MVQRSKRVSFHSVASILLMIVTAVVLFGALSYDGLAATQANNKQSTRRKKQHSLN